MWANNTMNLAIGVNSLIKHFDGTIALNNFSADFRVGTVTGIAGPNGAGKSTLFNIVTGFLNPDSGSVFLFDEKINHLAPWKIARAGIVRTFQQTRLVNRFTVLDNVLLALLPASLTTLSHAIWANWRIAQIDPAFKEKAHNILSTVGIDQYADLMVEDLSYGQQKIVSLLCCLAGKAKVVLLDEPVAGVNPETINIILGMIRKLPEQGVTVILIEHNMDAIMRVCDNLVFMDQGKKIVEGDPKMVRNDPAVIEAYLE